jgi:hypothetical protein
MEGYATEEGRMETETRGGAALDAALKQEPAFPGGFGPRDRQATFAQDDELFCVAELHPDNARRSAREHMPAGMLNPILAAD